MRSGHSSGQIGVWMWCCNKIVDSNINYSYVDPG